MPPRPAGHAESTVPVGRSSRSARASPPRALRRAAVLTFTLGRKFLELGNAGHLQHPGSAHRLPDSQS
jgi:hypothetical protein